MTSVVATNETSRRSATPDPSVRILRIIARLNIGGPAIQAITLTERLDSLGYATRLVRGTEDPDEGSMDDLAADLGVSPTLIPSMRRDPGLRDVAALWSLMRVTRADRPRIVHTHAAKAGTLGRVAALLALPRGRPVVVHTFHGHSLTGYFSSRTASIYRLIERWLARRTDALVAVSAEVRDDLVRLGVAPRERFTVIPVGLDLQRFLADAERATRRRALRSEWGLDGQDEVITIVSRLVPIKRVDRFLRVAQQLAARPDARFVVVGDGELRDELTSSAESRALGDRLVWTGFRCDMPDVCFASDVVVLTSDNEGTPVSLIEAQAAAVPVVGVDVGGVASVVDDGETGLLAAADDERGLAKAVAAILDDKALATRLAQAGRQRATELFTTDRLVEDLDRLYRELLASRGLASARGLSAD